MSKLILPNTSLENIKMVIFDKDGTLIDVHHYWCSMIEYRAEFFVKHILINDKEKDILYNELIDGMGIDLETKKMKVQGPVGIKPRSFIMNVTLDILREYDKSYTLEMVSEVFKEVDEYSQEKLTKIVKPLAHMQRVLSDLHNANIKISIATTDLTQRAIFAMKSLGVDGYFDDIVGADLVERAKPNPDLVQYIVTKHNFSLDEVVVVGDSIADLEMAKNAKCKFIGVRTGLYGNSFIRKSRYLISTLEELRIET